jgi:hypothetical protein
MRTLLTALHRDERGQIIYLTVASVIVFIALAALVINSGHMVTRRLETQNAVDAATISGAAWVARGMNIISMNNVATTELLGLTVVLRALKETWEEGSRRAQVNKYLCFLLIKPAAVKACRDLMETAKEYFDGHRQAFGDIIESATDPSSGFLWRGMDALAALSNGVRAAVPSLAVAEAGRVGLDNHADGVQLEPSVLLMPVEERRFSDLCHPTRVGSPSSYPEGLQRGYVPLQLRSLLDESYDRYNKGPLLEFRDEANGPALQFFLAVVFFENLFNSAAILEDNTDEEFGRFCQGSPAGHYSSSRNRPRPFLLKGTQRSTNRSLDALAEAKADLNYLGVGWRQSRLAFMRPRFTNPREHICVYGQARVFNATSFDLFTQDWRVKLVKADDFKDPLSAAVVLGTPCQELTAALSAALLNTH